MEKKIALGIIDDHQLFRSGVEDIINDSDKFEVLISASTSKELYDQLNHTEIEILLLDIKLKQESGLDILIKLKEEKPDLKIIMLTMHNEATYINIMVQKGANGYLMKDTTPEELLETIELVQKNGRYYNSETTNVIIESLQKKEKLESLGIDISSFEVQLIKMISEGMTADEISTKIHKSTRTIEGYRRKLLEKTQCKNIAELVSWGYKNNYL